jgi:hypothetical protein
MPPPGGSSRLLAVSGSDKVVSRGFTLALLVLLLPVAPLGALIGALRFFILVLPLILVTTKDGTNRLLAGGIVGNDVHQFVGNDRGIAAQLSDQLLAGGAREKSHDDVGVSDILKLGALFRETSDIVTKGLAQLLFTTPEVPRVIEVHVGPLEVLFEHSHQVVPIVDLSRWEVLEPRSSSVR